MATFVLPIARLLGRNDGKHMVATITVYFHPARSAGSMEEGTLCALAAFVYAAIISYGSMALSAFFGHHGIKVVGHVLVLLIFCGGGLGFVGWLKQRLGNPLVNVACSLASLAIITILTKEGAVQASVFSHEKIAQVLKMVLMGIFCSTLVSLLILPISARKEQYKDLMKTTNLLSEMLISITSTFLSGEEDERYYPSFTDVTTKYKAAFNSLAKNLREAKWEHYVLGTEAQHHIEKRLVHCVEQIATDIGGLRSAAATQFALMGRPSGLGNTTPIVDEGDSRAQANRLLTPDAETTFNGLEAIREIPEDSNDAGYMAEQPQRSMSIGASSATTPPDIFALFVRQLGPPLKSLAYTLKEVLAELPFGAEPKYELQLDNQFRASLVEANELFTKARREGLNFLYQNKVLSKARSAEVAADYEEVAASCGYFGSSMQDLAEDTIKYLELLEEFEANLKSPHKRSWHWIAFWRRWSLKWKHDHKDDVPIIHEQTPEAGLSQSIHSPKQALKKDFYATSVQKQRPITYRIWLALSFFRREDIRYAIKVGIGAILYAMMSFIPATRPTYSHWRGEWGLLSYMVVCSSTIGAAQSTGYQRFFGTGIGALSAIIVWIISRDNPIVLAFFGWAISIGCFYIIIGQGKGPMGRFILLTYNLSVLYSYSLTVKDDDDDDDEGGIDPAIWEIVLHRFVAVLIGCLWGVFITRFIWPISARRKLKDGISVLWLRMGMVWKRDPLSMLLDGSAGNKQEKKNQYMDIRESLALQRFLTKLEALQESAKNEFEMKGPFPNKTISRILAATGRMLDAFHAMNTVVVKDLKATPGEAALLRFTENERMQLSARISHLFSVLASSVKLEYPMNDALPSVEHTRDRLLAKVFEFRRQGGGEGVEVKDEDYELFYAYGESVKPCLTDLLLTGMCSVGYGTTEPGYCGGRTGFGGIVWAAQRRELEASVISLPLHPLYKPIRKKSLVTPHYLTKAELDRPGQSTQRQLTLQHLRTGNGVFTKCSPLLIPFRHTDFVANPHSASLLSLSQKPIPSEYRTVLHPLIHSSILHHFLQDSAGFSLAGLAGGVVDVDADAADAVVGQRNGITSDIELCPKWS